MLDDGFDPRSKNRFNVIADPTDRPSLVIPFDDGECYRMGDFIIMPDHVHLLAAFGI